MNDNNEVKRWTAKGKAALVKDIIRGKTNASEAAREFDLKLSEIQQWVDEAEAGMENALRANPRDVAEMYEKKIDELTSAYGEAMLELKARKSSVSLSRPGRGLVFLVQGEMAEDGDKVSVSQLSRWFGVPRRTLYYKPTKQAPKVNPILAKKVKALIDELPFAGYRALAFLLGLNRNTVQRINQIKGWLCR